MKKEQFVTRLDKKPPSKTLKIKTVSLAKYLNVGYYMIIPLLGAVALGVALDRYLNSKPYFTVGLITFGAVSSLYNMVRLIKDIKVEDATY